MKTSVLSFILFFSFSFGFAPITGQAQNSYYVNDNSTQGDIYQGAVGNDGNPGTQASPFATVNKAIGLAMAGDNIYIDAGTYAQIVFIGKSVNIIGAGAGLVKFVWPETIQSLFVLDEIPYYGQFNSYNNAINEPGNAANIINISGITIDGQNRVFNEKSYVHGIRFHNAGGKVENCVFKNFQNPGIADPTFKIDRAAYFQADQTSPAQVNFINNTISDFSSLGLVGAGTGMSLYASGNTITGNGVATKRQYGISAEFIKVANIEGNTISNLSNFYSQSNQNDMSFAVSVFGNANPSAIKNNIISNSPGGLLSTNTNITIEGNELTTPHTYGIALQGTSGTFNATLLSNTIIGSQFAVIAGSYNGAKSTVDIQQNSIINSVVNSIYNFGNNNIVAKCNWLGSSESSVVNASTFGGVRVYSLLASGTDISPEVRGFQSGTTNCIATPVSFYVNDNSVSDDKLTFAIGNDNNPGTKEAPFATAGKALREALGGDSVFVDAGTYAEKVILVKSVNIIGAGADLVKFVWPANVQPNYSVDNIPWYNQFDSYNGGGNNPAITINLSGITIDGEDRIFNEKAVVNGLKFHNTAGTVKDCIFKNFKNPGVLDPTFKTDRAVFLLVDAGSPAELNFLNNKIIDFHNVGLEASGAGLTLNAKGNEITGNGINTIRQRGINLSSIKAINLEGNTIRDISKYNVSNVRSYAVSANAIASPSMIKNNLVINANAGFLITSSNFTIEGNEMTTSQSYGFIFQASTGTSNINFLSNTISKSEVGILALISNNANMNLVLQENSLTDASSRNIINSVGANISATCNWFGTADARNVFASIEGNVTMNSLLASGEDASPDLRGFQKGDITCNAFVVSDYYVNDNFLEVGDMTDAVGSDNNPGTKEAPLATLKRALELAMPGSIIYVDAGNYREQALIRRSVTIRGAGRDKTNFYFPENLALNYQFTLSGATVNNYAIFHAQNVTGVTIENIAVDGENANFDKGRLYGISIERSSGVVSGCEVRNFKNDNLNVPTLATGSGIIGINLSSTTRNVEVFNNTVKDFYYSGIIMAGTNLTYKVHDNTIEGNGSSEFTQYGIDVFAGAGSVKDNSISNITEYTAQEFYESAGIFVRTSGPATDISGNLITDAEAGILLGNGSHVVKNNEVTGSLAYGIGAYASGSSNNSSALDNNLLSNNAVGLYFENFGTGTLTAEVHNNSITGSILNSFLNVNATVNASCNWFGAITKPEIEFYVSGTVNFTPWLTDGEDTDLEMVGFQPQEGSCTGNPFALSLVSQTDIVNCGDDQTGAINVSIEGGVGPLVIQWTKQGDETFNASTENLSNITKGIYDLTVTDANGETQALQVDLKGPDLLEATVFAEPAYCDGESSGRLQVFPFGGTPTEDYVYGILWSDGSTAEDRMNVSPGLYAVTVTDTKGCSITYSDIEVTAPDPILPVLNATDVLCNGGATGTALSSPTGGTLGVLDDFSTYTYLWSNGATTANVSGLSAGTYSVTVEDDYGCTGTASITVVQPTVLRATTQVTNVLCNGESNGSVTVNANGGTTPYRYSIDGGAVGSSNLFGSLAVGPHTVKVIDNNNCEIIANFTITQPTPIVISEPTVVATCLGSATGSITLTATGGTGVLRYNWTGPNGFTATRAAITGLAAGAYTLIVTDANNCTSTTVVNVTIASAISVTGTIVNIGCFGAATGSITLVSPAVQTGITYAWTGPNNYKSTARNIGALRAGVYTVTVKLGACSYVQSFTVTQPAAALTMTLSKVDIIACGGRGTINISSTTGGTAPYQYSLNNAAFQSAGSFTGLAAGTYNVRVRDVNGCLFSSSITIADNGNDSYEPNNKQTVASAYVLNSGNINARIAPTATDIDWYKFTAKPTAGLRYTITLTHPTIRYAFDLYDSRARLVAPSTSVAGLTAIKTYTNLVAGAVYSLRIQGSLSLTCYQMSIADGTGILSQANLINNTLVTAANGITKPGAVPVQLEASVAPNPHPGQFNLNISSPVNGMAKVELVTVSGQVINKQQVALKKGSNSIRYENINSGMLIYRVTVNDMQTTGRIIGIK